VTIFHNDCNLLSSYQEELVTDVNNGNGDALISNAKADTGINLFARPWFEGNWGNSKHLLALIVYLILWNTKRPSFIIIDYIVVNVLKLIIMIKIVSIPLMVCLKCGQSSSQPLIFVLVLSL